MRGAGADQGIRGAGRGGAVGRLLDVGAGIGVFPATMKEWAGTWSN
jgi:hypothetical protein